MKNLVFLLLSFTLCAITLVGVGCSKKGSDSNQGMGAGVNGDKNEAEGKQTWAKLPERLRDPQTPVAPPAVLPTRAQIDEPVDESGVVTPPPGNDEERLAAALAEPSDKTKENLPDSVKKLADGKLAIGSIVLDREKGTFTLPGRFNQKEGIVEYLAVGPKGKTHESVLVFEVEGIQLQVACILLGLQQAPLPEQKDLDLLVHRSDKREPDPAPPTTQESSAVEIWVSWKESALAGGKTVRHRAEDLLWNKEKSKPMEHHPWIFTGSTFWNGHFVADTDQSYVATWPDRSAIFNTPVASQNPYRVVNGGFEVHKALVPDVGQPVQVQFIRVAKGGGSAGPARDEQ